MAFFRWYESPSQFSYEYRRLFGSSAQVRTWLSLFGWSVGNSVHLGSIGGAFHESVRPPDAFNDFGARAPVPSTGWCRGWWRLSQLVLLRFQRALITAQTPVSARRGD